MPTKGSEMTGDFDPRAHDARLLTPQQWMATRQAIIRNARAERGRMIRSSFVAALAALHIGWRRLCDQQQARASLRAMSDYDLRDIGVTRAGIETAIRGAAD